ncbi:MAG: hypothetical protein IMF01_09565 [Proteobacteria bacterium]|nr:hypothetical protein [Pseudomonadota bacterium]
MSSKDKRKKRAKAKKKEANILKASKPKVTQESKKLDQKLKKRGSRGSGGGKYNIKNIQFYRDLAAEVAAEKGK